MIVSGIIGGLVAFGVTVIVTRRVEKGGRPGQLYFGAFMWAVGIVGVLMALGPVIAVLAHPRDDLVGWLFLSAVFGAAAVYCLGEAAFVRGTFDEDGIAFSTPWTGAKRELWKDVVSIEYHPHCSWYAIRFASGAVVRLSSFLYGSEAAVYAARRRFALHRPQLQGPAKSGSRGR